MIGSKTMSKFHYEGKFAIAGYRIAKHPNTYPYYLSCYHGEKPQACRRSLKWRDIEYACAVVRSLLDSGIAGDALDDRSLRTVVELLDWHSDSVEGPVLCEAGKEPDQAVEAAAWRQAYQPSGPSATPAPSRCCGLRRPSW
jgi:hypothetical protein